jgi:hypothetical protein
MPTTLTTPAAIPNGPRRLSENKPLEREVPNWFRRNLKILRPNLKLAKTSTVLTLELVHDGLIQCIFTYIAGFVV